MDREIKGLLIDLDGVLYVGGSAIEGAKEALEALQEKGIACRFVTNTTTKTAGEVVEKLHGLGFEVDADQVFSAVSATRQLLLGAESESSRVHLIVRDSILSEFEEFFPWDAEDPDYVVVGDIGAKWSYPLMDRAFRELMNGAELIAMHKNRYFEAEEGLRLDIGCFVSGLEFATGNAAKVVGKPSPDFFRLGLESLGLPAENVAMIGDDIDSDVGGGQAIGLAGILVRTGKYREAYANESEVNPDAIIDSIADLPALLG